MGSRVIRPDTAFAASKGRKRPRHHSAGHLAFIRKLPCVLSSRECQGPVEAAHIRYTELRYGKRDVGREKPDDRWTLPVCQGHHRLQHQGDEFLFWRVRNINPCVTALALWGVTGDEELAGEILRRASQTFR